MSKKETKNIVSPDDAMEEPKTKNYNAAPQPEQPAAPQQGQQQMFIQILDTLRPELDKTIGELGYNREIGSPEMHLQVFQVFEVLDKTKGKYLTEEQANQLISMIARAPYNVVGNLMKDIIENQAKYFKVVSREQIEEEAKKASEEEKA